MSAHRGRSARTIGLLAMSVATHLMVFSALGRVPSPAQVVAMHEMTFEIIEPKPPEPPPEIEPPEPEPEPERPKLRAKSEPPPEAVPPEEVKAVPEEVQDFTGETLTTTDGSGAWSTVVGSGAPLRGPVGKIAKTATPAPAAPAGPQVVALGSLARKPVPPSGLDAALQRNYPSRARLQGVEGRVATQLRILPTGRIGRIRVLEESPGGFEFASACRKMLEQAPAFVAPLDRSGTPVSADVTFVCTFEVNY